MSKAVLVMDMPETCSDCDFCNNGYCAVKNEFCSNREEEKQDWCTLRPLPEKKDIKKCKTMTDLGWIEGWNACLEVIGGDT